MIGPLMSLLWATKILLFLKNSDLWNLMFFISVLLAKNVYTEKQDLKYGDAYTKVLICFYFLRKLWLLKDNSIHSKKAKCTHTRANTSHVSKTIHCNTERCYLNPKYKIAVSGNHCAQLISHGILWGKLNQGQNCTDVAKMPQELMTSLGMFCILGLGSLYLNLWCRVLQCINK